MFCQALDTVHKFTPQEFTALSDLLSPELIDQCQADTGVVTLRKRRLPMEMMVWACCITGSLRELPLRKGAQYQVVRKLGAGQELWGVALAYNLLRFMMAQMAYSLKNVEPYQMGFKRSALYLRSQLSIIPGWRRVNCQG